MCEILYIKKIQYKMSQNLDFFRTKIFQIFLLTTLLNFSFSSLSFKYPYAMKLNDGNIFVIHQNGATICNENFTEIIANTYYFNETQKIKTDEEFSKIESVSGGGHIIVIIHDYIYFFNSYGYLMRISSEKITESEVELYSLVYLSYDFSKSYIYFLVGYILNSKLNLNYYRYQHVEMTLTKLNTFGKEDSSNIISNNALSCHNMNISYTWVWKTYYKDIITCLYASNNNYYINLDFFEISGEKIIESGEREQTKFILDDNDKDPVYIRGALYEGNMRLTFGWITRAGVPYYRQYDIEKKVFKADAKFFSKSYCKLIYHGFKIKYFPEKKEVMYTCIFDRNGWTEPKANILVETLAYGYQTNYTYKFNDCDFSGYSIIYYTDEKQYYISSQTRYVLMNQNLLFIYLVISKIILKQMMKKNIIIMKKKKKKKKK